VAWFVKVDSIKGTDTTLIHKQLAAVTLFDNYVFYPPTPPLDSTLAVGGAPSARSILRVALPRAIRDSSQIIRATLILVPAVPVQGAPSDSFVVEAHTVLADFGAKSPLFFDATRTDTTFVRVGATDTVRIEVTNLLQFWTSDSTRPEVMMLRSQGEGGHLSEIRFYRSAAAAYRPALRITYARRCGGGGRHHVAPRQPVPGDGTRRAGVRPPGPGRRLHHVPRPHVGRHAARFDAAAGHHAALLGRAHERRRRRRPAARGGAARRLALRPRRSG